MRGALLRAMRRLFPDCRSADAHVFRREFATLEQRLGPFDDGVRPAAIAAVVFQLRFERDTAALERAEDARARGKGRRPSVSAIASLKKRQGLSFESWQKAVARLEEVAPHRGNRAPSPTEYLATRAAAGGDR